MDSSYYRNVLCKFDPKTGIYTIKKYCKNPGADKETYESVIPNKDDPDDYEAILLSDLVGYLQRNKNTPNEMSIKKENQHWTFYSVGMRTMSFFCCW